MGDTIEPSSQPTPTDRPRPLFSRFYAQVSPRMEAEGMSELRDELLADLTGTVVEVGCGNGLNFTHYPPSVRRVIAVEPEPRLRTIATQAAAGAAVPVSVQPGIATQLSIADGSVDAAVLCLVMCSLDDRPGALAEIRRVLRPGGTLHFLEHTISEERFLRTVQRLADATVWPLLTGGCHTATNPVALIQDAGYTIVRQRRLRFPESRITMPATPHVMGAARR
jgi:ubiquinone/menaquinone biosynthesis C-methylase UbiE